MNSFPLISIIIPVYNAESTIARTLDSLTNNAYDIEIICVNDGSKDESKAIIDQKISGDHRIRQIVQENGGASKARNTGISHAAGEYLMFCDADDEYDSQVLKYITEDIEEFKPDYIVFDRRTVYENGTGFDWFKKKEKTFWNDFSWAEYFNHILSERNHTHVVFNKVYKAQLVRGHQITFSENLLLCEDLYFNFAYLHYAGNMVEDGRAKYLQHKVSSSLTAGKRPDHFFQNIKVLDILAQEYREEINQCDIFFSRHILNSAINAVDRALLGRDAQGFREKREIINKILNDSHFREAYKKHADVLDLYTRKRLKLLYNRLIVIYYIRYILLPRIKGKIFK